MTNSGIDRSQMTYARMAGFLFLFVIAADILGMWMSSGAAAHGSVLYRAGVLSQLIGSVSTVFLAFGLYVTLKPVDGNLALLALVFRAVEAADGLQLKSAFDTVHSGAPATGFYVPSLFFSVGSTIFFYLFLKSGYIPKLLSILGLCASVVVTALCVTCLLVPAQAGALQPAWIPMAMAEISVGLWLLFQGIRVRPRHSGTGTRSIE